METQHTPPPEGLAPTPGSLRSRLQAELNIIEMLMKPLKAAMAPHEARKRDIFRQCKEAGHFAFPTEYDGSECSVCGVDLGWWCPDSANHRCEYTDSEYCDHCGAPEERL